MNIVPETIKHELSKALLHADKHKVVMLIEQNQLDANAIVNSDRAVTILHEAINTLENYRGSNEQREIVEWLLEHGADSNMKNKEGYNCLHLALEYHDLSKISLLLLRKSVIDVNTTDANGNTALFIAMREYRLTWRPEQKEVNELRFQIIEELLKRGADLDFKNLHGASPRTWLNLSRDARLHALVGRYTRRN